MDRIADLRQDYRQSELLESQALPDALAQFRLWFDQALAAQIPEPNAMTLATASPTGAPSARIVLLKGVDDEGFVFYTNYASRKAQQIEANPHVSLVFFWLPIERQVCIEGVAQRVSRQEADDYFHSRPAGSQLGAWASHQSSVVPSRQSIEDAYLKYESQYQDQAIPLPDFWGGYRVIPSSIEFWQGRTSRLHDRLRYTRQDDGQWTIDRLSP